MLDPDRGEIAVQSLEVIRCVRVAAGREQLATSIEPPDPPLVPEVDDSLGAAERDAPDRLADETWGERAEAICARAVEDIEAMPGALDAVDGPDRARQVEATNVRYEAMLAELDGLDVADDDPRDVEISTGWLADWRVLIEDRYTYAEGIAVDDQTQFFITDTGVAERLDRRVTRLANTNDMPSCAAPTDLG